MNREKINWKKFIKAGNIVKVREWDDMKKEYGSYYSANKVIINCSKKFTEEMKEYCGKTIKINENMEKKFNECGYFYYEGYMFSTDMLEPYTIPYAIIEEEREREEIITPNIENHWIKEKAIYVIKYDDTEGKTFLGSDNFITFKGKIINFTNDKCFIVDQEKGLVILDVKNIISMIPVKVN